MKTLFYYKALAWVIRLAQKLNLHFLLPSAVHIKMAKESFLVPLDREMGINNIDMDEFWMIGLLDRLDLDADSMFIDIGANVGQSLIKWKSIKPEGAYLGIEPNPDCVGYLLNLIRCNQWNDCQVLPFAVSNRNRESLLHLHFKDRSDRSASLLRSDFNVTKSIKVTARPLCELLDSKSPKARTRNIIKIDAEGSEYDIIKSISERLADRQDYYIIEILCLYNTREMRIEILRLFHKAAYRVYQIRKKNDFLEDLKLVTRLDGEYPVEESDFLAVPESVSPNIDIKPCFDRA